MPKDPSKFADGPGNVNPFYVGASAIANAIKVGSNANSTFPNIEDAIAAAKRHIIDKREQIAIVVQIVKIVRIKEPEVEVVDVM